MKICPTVPQMISRMIPKPRQHSFLTRTGLSEVNHLAIVVEQYINPDLVFEISLSPFTVFIRVAFERAWYSGRTPIYIVSVPEMSKVPDCKWHIVFPILRR